MTDNNPTEAHPPAGSDEAKPDGAQTSDTKASDGLSEDDLEAVAGGVGTITPVGQRKPGSNDFN